MSTKQPNERTHELTSADLDTAVGGGKVQLQDLSVVKTLDKSSSAATGGGGAGKVQMQDLHFTVKLA